MTSFISTTAGPFSPPLCPLTSFLVFRYVVNAAKAAKADKDQRLIYLSVRTLFACMPPRLVGSAPFLTTGVLRESQVISFVHA